MSNMHEQRIVNLNWAEIESFLLSPDQLKMLKHILDQGQILRLIGDISSQSLIFRHDRVRDWLSASSIAKDLSTGKLCDSFISEPFYSKVIGMSLNKNNINPEIVRFIKTVNPLALFYALQDFSFAKTNNQKAVLSSIQEWLQDKETNKKSNENLKFECSYVMANTESVHILDFIKFFKNGGWPYYQAGFRNGDLEIGREYFSHRINTPGVNNPSHEKLVNYVLSKHRQKIITYLDDLLSKDKKSKEHRSGTLIFAGYTKDSNLFNSLKYAWDHDDDREELLDDYFWACAQCCGDNPSALLDHIFDSWASLPEKSEKDELPSSRDSFAAHEIRWAFQRHVPKDAIDYFIKQTNRQELNWPITYMLQLIDHPSVMVYLASYFSNKDKDALSFSFLHLSQEWERRQKTSGYHMSRESREKLYKQWTNNKLKSKLREASFYLWAMTKSDEDINILKQYEQETVLQDLVLKERIKRKDYEVLPQLEEKLRNSTKNDSWWFLARNFWTVELINLLDEELSKRSQKAPRKWDDFFYSSDWNTPYLLKKISAHEAESILIKHWDHLKYSSLFVQTALYVATDELLSLVAEVVLECPDPKTLFKYLDQHYGIREKGHPGVTDIRQLNSLVPYIDYLGKTTIQSLWSLCNERGWFEFRKKYFDTLLQYSGLIHTQFLSGNKVIQSLNDICVKDHKQWHAKNWVDDYLETGVKEREILDSVFNWIKEQEKITVDVIETSLAVIVKIGNRSQFQELLNICKSVKVEYSDHFDNAYFLLRKTQLH